MSLTDLLKLFSLRPRFHKLYGKDIFLPPGELEGWLVVAYNTELSKQRAN